MTILANNRPTISALLEQNVEIAVQQWYRKLIAAAQSTVLPTETAPGNVDVLAKLIVESNHRLVSSAEQCQCSDVWFGSPESKSPYWEIRHRSEAKQKALLYAVLCEMDLFDPLGKELRELAAKLTGSMAASHREYLKHVRTRFLNRINPDVGFFVPKH